MPNIQPYYGAFPVDTEWARAVGKTPNSPVMLTLGYTDVDLSGVQEYHYPWYTEGYASLGDADSISILLRRFSPTTGPVTALSTSTTTGNFTYTPTVAGYHKARYTWTWDDEGCDWKYDESFDVVDMSGGGSSGGRIIAIKSFEPPGVVHVVYETINGDLVAKQNPQ